MKFLKNQRAQTAIEYLILVAAAIALATLLGLYLKSVPQETGKAVQSRAEEAFK